LFHPQQLLNKSQRPGRRGSTEIAGPVDLS
jgi:hypothetical protein